jgi:hypothetical protein
MPTESNRIQELVENPSESLSVEIKRWIDPAQVDGIAKIVKTAIALRNHGGGYIVIGFDNNTLQPDRDNAPADVKEMFHMDKIQGMIAKYASEPFEISMEFPENAGQIYPVIVIPSGVKTPVAAKKDLSGQNGSLIKVNAVYVRSLSSNNTPSTTQVGWKDWSNLVETCFDNREADIGRFLRRHLSGLNADIIREIATELSTSEAFNQSTENLLRRYIQESEARYRTIAQGRDIDLPDHGTWEVALIIQGEIPPHKADRKFLNLLDANNPDYTGWPIWLISTRFDESARPYTYEGIWEAYITTNSFGSGILHDFMRLDPKGKFYLRRILEDDAQRENGPAPMTVLDGGLVMYRVAEAIAVGIAFAKAMGCDVEKTELSFAFRWSHLHGRILRRWARSLTDNYFWDPYGSAHQNEVMSFINVSLETPLSALSQHISSAIQPLFEAFDGYSVDDEFVENLTRKLIERRM